MGTARGLARWDGERFRPWAPEAVSGEVVAILTQAGERIWVGTGGEGLTIGADQCLKKPFQSDVLRDAAGNVSEIAYGVGFVTLSGFHRAYREHYGEAPSASLQQA